MQVKCEFCGNYIDEAVMQCPYCGAPNENAKRGAHGTPQTIEELKAFALEKGLPLEKMRFFIGEDYKAPKAFGIYREEDGQIVVYKNKADGTRIIRYRGTDEAYGVNELYQKMRTEVHLRRSKPVSHPSTNKRELALALKLIITGAAILLIVFIVGLFIPEEYGYYYYNNAYYYQYNDSWYTYDGDSWVYTTIDEELEKNRDDYFQGDVYRDDFGIEGFQSDMDGGDWEEDWDDDDWDWDADSDWDSGDTDWDSDW